MTAEALKAARAETVRKHVDSENEHDFESTIRTFAKPRYELIGTGDVYDGGDAVRGYFAEMRIAFPDLRNRVVAMHHCDDTVIVEFVLEGTHLGALRGLPPTSGRFSVQSIAVFIFETDSDLLICERVYFDTAIMFRQLGLGSDPRSFRGRVETVLAHPLTIARAILGSIFGPPQLTSRSNGTARE